MGSLRNEDIEDGTLAIAMAVSALRIDAILLCGEDVSPVETLGTFAAFPNVLRDVGLYYTEMRNGKIRSIGAYVSGGIGSAGADLCSAQSI